jgi:hypothetical protein
MEIQERQVLDIFEVSSHAVHHSNQPELTAVFRFLTEDSK